MKTQLYLPDEARTRLLGALIGQQVAQQAFIALTGPLGAGKTTLVQGVGEGLQVSETINSPTFTMLNEYHSGRLPLYHLDLYRMNEAGTLGAKSLDLLAAELDEFIHLPGVVLVEWAEHLEKLLPGDHINIDLQYADETASGQGRQVQVFCQGPNSTQLAGHVIGMFINSPS